MPRHRSHSLEFKRQVAQEFLGVIVDGLVRTVLTRRIAPAQPVSDNEDDAADHQPIINPRNNGKYGSIRRICVFDSKNRSAIVTTPRDTNESANHANRNNLNSSALGRLLLALRHLGHHRAATRGRILGWPPGLWCSLADQQD